jgi:pilus assembly protein CpaB
MKRSIVAIALAGLLAIVACGAVLLYVRGADARALAGKQAVKVLIAAKRIPAGTSGAQIREKKYAVLVNLPAASVPDDVMSTLDVSLDGLVVTSDIQPRQLLLRGAFGAPTNLASGLNVPEGKIAVSVPAFNSAGTAFLRPGSQVAVFDTFTVREGAGQTPSGVKLKFEYEMNHATRLLLPRAEVIAVGLPGQDGAATSGGDAGTQPEDGKASAIENSGQTVVTFALSQDEAQKVIHAAQTGTLYLALLNETSDVRPGPGVDNKTLFG